MKGNTCYIFSMYKRKKSGKQLRGLPYRKADIQVFPDCVCCKMRGEEARGKRNLHRRLYYSVYHTTGTMTKGATGILFVLMFT